MAFIQFIEVRTDDVGAVGRHLEQWDRDQANAAPGFVSHRFLEDRDEPGRYVIEVEFAGEAEAKENSDRPETQAWAEGLRSLVSGEPTYRNLVSTEEV